MNSTTTTVRINYATTLDGVLYEIQGEDSPYFVSDMNVVAVAEDGRRFVHTMIAASGCGFCAETGCNYPVRKADQLAKVQGALDSINARRVIDLRYWDELPQTSLEGRLAEQAEIEDQERRGVRW